MKVWMTVLALVAVMGMAGLADAKGAGKHKGTGIHGKIQSVSPDSFTMTTGGKKNPHTMTVKFTANTTFTGDAVVGGKMNASMVGKHATVVGGTTGDVINATQVTISAGHHHKKKAA